LWVAAAEIAFAGLVSLRVNIHCFKWASGNASPATSAQYLIQQHGPGFFFFDCAHWTGCHAGRLFTMVTDNRHVFSLKLVLRDSNQGSGWVVFLVMVEGAKQLARPASDASFVIGYQNFVAFCLAQYVTHSSRY
jgi:hypothetical protein